MEYAETVRAQLAAQDIRVDIDSRSERMNLKIRNAQMQKIPYMLVVGDREQEGGTVAVRLRNGDDLGAIGIDEIKERILNEVQTYA